MESKEGTDLSKVVLAPDHPLLAQFQKVLKEYLISQIYRAKGEIHEIDQNIDSKNKEIEVIGNRTYDLQQSACNQQRELDDLINNIKLKESQQQEQEKLLANNKKVLKEIENKLIQSEKANKDLLTEIEAMVELNNHLQRYETKIETHINVHKRIADKVKKDSDTLIKQKKRQDYMLSLLEKEITKQENELGQMQLQVNAQQRELEKLEELVVIENTNISTKQSEYKCLMHSWKIAHHAVVSRTQTFDELSKKVIKLKEDYQTLYLQTKNTKKLTKQELAQNENLVQLKNRVDLDVKNISAEFNEQAAKKSDIENGRLQQELMLQEIEAGLRDVREELRPKLRRLDPILREINSLQNRKKFLEKEIVDITQSAITNENLKKRVVAHYTKMHYKKVEMELLLTDAENKRAAVAADYEAQKNHNENLMIVHNDLRAQLDMLEQEAEALKLQHEKMESKYRRLQKTFVVKSNQLEKQLVSRTSESKSDLRIIELNRAINDTQESIKSLQLLWLREQNNILSKSDERQEQIHKVNLIKKELLILEQKNLRIEDDIQQIKQNENKVASSINRMSVKLEKLSEHVFKTRNKKALLGKSNTLMQSEFESKLKDNELILLELEAEIAEIEEDKLNLSKQLIETNKEGLEWEKEYHNARELYLEIRGEKGYGGEAKSLKIQIQKLNVIYNQHKKVQEKLLFDLKNCISKRESIFFVAEAKEMKQAAMKKTKTESRMRMNIIKKLDGIKNQIKHTNNETEKIKKSILSVKEQIEEYQKKIDHVVTNRSSRDCEIDDLHCQLEAYQTNRQFKFEVLVLKQRKAIMYSQLLKNQKPYLKNKIDNETNYELKLQKNTNIKLMKIIEHMIKMFPSRITVLNRLYNSLSIVRGTMYT